MDALELLTEQHREAKQLLEQILESSKSSDVERLFNQANELLELHEELEEKYLNPPLREDKEFRSEILEGCQEHHVMDVLLEELGALKPTSEEFKPKVTVLMEQIEHHGEEEEEKKLFPEVRKAWSQGRIDEAVAKMAELRDRRTTQPQKKAA